MSFSHVRMRLRLGAQNGATTNEAFYLASSIIGDPSTPGTCIPTGLNWAQKRRMILSPNWRVISLHITPAYLPGETPMARSGYNTRIPNGVGTYGGAMDQPNVVGLLTMRTANGHVREYAIHGFPDASTVFDATSGAEITGAGPEFIAYVNYMIGTPHWQLRVLKVGTTGVGTNPITSISVAGGVVSFIVPGLGAVSVGDKFRVAALKGYKVQQFAGEWRIASYDTGTGVLTARSSRYIDSNFFLEFGTGTIRVDSPTTIGYEDIVGADIAGSHSGTHKVGNVQEGVRGRRSRRN